MLSAVGLTAFQLSATAAAIMFASVLRGFTGFGFALAAVPLASLFMPPSRIVAAILVMQLGIGLRDCFMEWRQSDRPALARLTIGALAGMPLGVLALALLSASQVRAILGVAVLGAAALTWKPHAARRPPPQALTLATGFTSGVFHGLAAMAGPPAVAYFLAFQPKVAVMRSSLMVFFPVVSLLSLPMVYAAGLLDTASATLGLLGMPIMIGGGWLGTWAFKRYGARSYRPLALAALIVTAAASIIRALVDLAG